MSNVAFRYYVRIRARNVARLRAARWSPRRWFGKPRQADLELIAACVDLERANNYAEDVLARLDATARALSSDAGEA